jgi:hypothetical protein
MGDVEVEIVRLSDYRIEACRGCKVCFEKGEAYCPLKDDLFTKRLCRTRGDATPQRELSTMR